MAARLATLGASGAEGIVLYTKKRFSFDISFGFVSFIVRVSLKEPEEQQCVRSPCSLSGFFFSYSIHTLSPITERRRQQKKDLLVGCSSSSSSQMNNSGETL